VVARPWFERAERPVENGAFGSHDVVKQAGAKWAMAAGLVACAAAAGCEGSFVDRGLDASRAGRACRVAGPSGGGRSFEVRLDQASASDRRRLREALGTVRAIFDDADFRDEVRRSRWLESADGELLERGDSVVARLLEGEAPAFDVLVNPQGLGQWLGLATKTVATAEVCSHVSVRPDRVAAWDGPARGLLVNTLAHEVSHLFADGACSADGPAALPRYRDDGYGECTRLFLVSYKLGDMAQCFYESRLGGGDFEGCMNGRVGGGPFAPGRDRASSERACVDVLKRRPQLVAAGAGKARAGQLGGAARGRRGRGAVRAHLSPGFRPRFAEVSSKSEPA
jgi:hypothetical protein